VYRYSNLREGVYEIERQFGTLLREKDLQRAVRLYTKRWQRFYGFHNKYTGKGETR